MFGVCVVYGLYFMSDLLVGINNELPMLVEKDRIWRRETTRKTRKRRALIHI